MIIDGKRIANAIKDEIAAQVSVLVSRGYRRPHLAAVLVGHDGASETYVANKVRSCHECGFDSTLVRHESNVTQQELLDTISRLNHDDGIDGFIVQLPLPTHIHEQQVIEAIDPSKDVDGFHPYNAGRMLLGLPCFIPATPLGIMELLRRSHITTAGKHCVVLGRSNIAGKPLACLLMQKGEPGNGTVTVCHRATQNLDDITRSADILIAAVGVPQFVKADMVKDRAVVIDVGITRLPDSSTKSGWKLHGDVDFDNVAPKCSFITPVPGGVGPMTVAALMLNTLQARKAAIGLLDDIG